MSSPVADFAAECVHPEPEGVITPEALRVAFVAWCSDRRIRPGVGAGLGKAVVAAGGRRRLRPLRWEGVALAPLADSGYRVPRARGPVAEDSPEGDPLPGLMALAGIAADPRALDVAWLRLTGSPEAVLCTWCGVLTRHTEERTHVACR
jgi:hypothetical protein